MPFFDDYSVTYEKIMRCYYLYFIKSYTLYVFLLNSRIILFVDHLINQL